MTANFKNQKIKSKHKISPIYSFTHEQQGLIDNKSFEELEIAKHIWIWSSILTYTAEWWVGGLEKSA